MRKAVGLILAASLWTTSAYGWTAYPFPADDAYHECVYERVIELAAEDAQFRPDQDEDPRRLAALAMASCSSEREKVRRATSSFYGDMPSSVLPGKTQVQSSLRRLDMIVFYDAIQRVRAFRGDKDARKSSLPNRQERLELERRNVTN